MSFGYYVKKALSLPPHVIATKAINKLKRKLSSFCYERKDVYSPTYALNLIISSEKLFAFFRPIPIDVLKQQAECILELSNLYLNHSFDLLGSGWVNVKHGKKCRGLDGSTYNMGKPVVPDINGKWLEGRINQANIKESKNIWKLIKSGYQPIDWQLDFKSGYRWSENTWSKNIVYGHKAGVDIKLPWELARMQHLSMLAWAYALAIEKQEGFAAPDIYLNEFRNQVLDFIATNPPRYGVNWVCTMDVGIRIANILVAYDLFSSFGAEFDQYFCMILQRSVYEHGKHCLENLEYSPQLRSNHYLSDIAGLLFAAAYLPLGKEVNRWLVFAVQEIISEMKHEFHPDGSNFEASTSYHRLSAEIMADSAFLCLLLPSEKRKVLNNYDINEHQFEPKLKPPAEQEYSTSDFTLFPCWFWERLERAGEFTADVIKPTGQIIQIGDNDSGRFLKLWPSFRISDCGDIVRRYKNMHEYSEMPTNSRYWNEDILDHSHLLGVIGRLFNRADLIAKAPKNSPEICLIDACLVSCLIPSYHHRDTKKIENVFIESENKRISDWIRFLTEKNDKPLIKEFVFPKNIRPGDNLSTVCYPGFGLYIYRSPQLYLSIRCGSTGQKGNGGHAHNDQLSIDLTIAGIDFTYDPGSFIYTPLPEKRNYFRSVKAHNVPCKRGEEQNIWLPGIKGLFFMTTQYQGEPLYFMTDGFVGSFHGQGEDVFRVVALEEDKVVIYDFGREISVDWELNSFSDGYGRTTVSPKS